MRILQLFGVDEARWDQIMTIAREAQERGWWEKFADEMGTRQALYANLEAGASAIREYQMVFLPGLLQLPAYTEARARIDRADRRPATTSPRARRPRRTATHGRAARRTDVRRHHRRTRDPTARRATRRGGCAVRPPGRGWPHASQLTIRVLPIDVSDPRLRRAPVGVLHLPLPRPGDPVVVAVDTVTDDLVLTRPDDVHRYLDLYNRIEDAALPPSDSLDFLAAAAEPAERKPYG